MSSPPGCKVLKGVLGASDIVTKRLGVSLTLVKVYLFCHLVNTIRSSYLSETAKNLILPHKYVYYEGNSLAQLSKQKGNESGPASEMRFLILCI